MIWWSKGSHIFLERQVRKVSDLTKTIKLRFHVFPEQEILLRQMIEQYRLTYHFVSQYIFDNSFN